jgi:putative FmdB family regulatory protein
MPLYEYKCEACEHLFEVIQRFSDEPIAVCPSCGQGPVVKLLSSPAIQFKGTGWYITDYARKGKDGAGGAESSGAGKKKEPSAGEGAAKTSESASGSGSPPASSSKE